MGSRVVPPTHCPKVHRIYMLPINIGSMKDILQCCTPNSIAVLHVHTPQTSLLYTHCSAALHNLNIH